MSGPERYEPLVRAFSAAMARKFAIPSNVEKGDWAGESPNWLFARLVSEVGELAESMANGIGDDLTASECVDVANFAAMLWEKLQKKEPR